MTDAAHADELGVPRHQRHERMHEEVGHEQVEDGRQPEVEREAPHGADREPYSTPAPINDTRSAARIVRNDRVNARSTQARTVEPPRTSSFNRSKYTM